jgi:hypothetical protein
MADHTQNLRHSAPGHKVRLSTRAWGPSGTPPPCPGRFSLRGPQGIVGGPQPAACRQVQQAGQAGRAHLAQGIEFAPVAHLG